MYRPHLFGQTGLSKQWWSRTVATDPKQTPVFYFTSLVDIPPPPPSPPPPVFLKSEVLHIEHLSKAEPRWENPLVVFTLSVRTDNPEESGVWTETTLIFIHPAVLDTQQAIKCKYDNKLWSSARQNLQLDLRDPENSDQPPHPRSLISLCWSMTLLQHPGYQKGINENPCLTGWIYRLIWVFAGHTDLIVGFVVRSSYKLRSVR